MGAGAVWVLSPVAAKKATGMIEKAVQIIQQVLGKTLDEDRGQWAPLVERAELEVNRRSIEHLGFFPCEIFLGFQPALELETEYPSYHREASQAVMNIDYAFQYDREEEEDCIIRFIASVSMHNSDVSESIILSSAIGVDAPLHYCIPISSQESLFYLFD